MILVLDIKKLSKIFGQIKKKKCPIIINILDLLWYHFIFVIFHHNIQNITNFSGSKFYLYEEWIGIKEELEVYSLFTCITPIIMTQLYIYIYI